MNTQTSGHGQPVAASLIALGDVICTPDGTVARVITKGQARGEWGLVTIGWAELRTGTTGRRAGIFPTEQVTLVTPSPMRGAA